MGSSSGYGNYFDLWLKSQEQLIGSWTEAVKGVQQAMFAQATQEQPVTGTGNGNGSYDPFSAYSSWLTSTAISLNKAAGENLDVIRDTVAKSLNGSNVYARLYRVWIPIFQAMQERPFDIDAYRELLDPAAYREVLDEVFGFNLEATTRLYNETLKTLETLNSATLDFLSPWARAANENIKLMPQVTQGHPEFFINMYHNMISAFDRTYGRAFQVPAVGKDRERIELTLRTLDDLSDYLAKSAYYQHELYLAGLSAMESVIETVANKISKGEFRSFNEVFDLWIAENEKKYLEISQTDEFSRTQGELLNAGLKARQSFFKLAEIYLEDFPVAVRSEMDDLYKTIYDLKRKVRNLERQVAKAAAGEVKA